MTYLSHTNAPGVLAYSKLETGFGMIQELSITGCVGSTSPERHKRNEQ